MHSSMLIKLLAERHKDDVFIAECKNGSSYGDRLLKMDGWAMRKSWAHPCVSGYEVKVSRADFLGDKKWPGYLKYCNEFYFVSPPDIIKLEELGADVGLLYCSANGGRLYTKKKAPFRNLTIPESIFRYIIMRLSSDDQYGRPDREYWREWLEQKDEDKELGRAVSKKVSELLTQRIAKVERKNHELQLGIEKFADLQQQLNAMGFTNTWLPNKYDVVQRLKRLTAAVPERLSDDICNTILTLQKFQHTLTGLCEPEDVPDENVSVIDG
jgi:hypothetical protein